MKKTEKNQEHIEKMIEEILGEAYQEEGGGGHEEDSDALFEEDDGLIDLNELYDEDDLEDEEAISDIPKDEVEKYAEPEKPEYICEEDADPDDSGYEEGEATDPDDSEYEEGEIPDPEDSEYENEEESELDEFEEYEDDEEYDEDEEELIRKPKKKKKRRRKIARWKKLLLTLEFMILAVIILVAVYLAKSGVFEVSDVVFGELGVEEIYYVAGQGETAIFTIQAENSEMEMQLCDAEETVVGTMHDDGQNGDETAGDGIYTCSLAIADAEAGARTYHVKEAKTASNEVTIYIFQTMDAEALESAGSVCDEVREALREIEAGYVGTSGYVTVEDFDGIFAEVEAYLETLVADGTVIRYVVEDESAYIKFASGLSLCYEPILRDTFSGESDVQLTVTYIQPDEGGYAADCAQTLGSAMAQFENLENGETYVGGEVTLSTVKSLASGQVIVWYGHGTYSSVTGSGLVLDISPEDFAEADQADLFKDHLTTVYPEDGEQHLAVTASYIEKYCGDLSNDLIFLSACNAGKDSRLADSFLACGATAVLCFSDSVLCEYASGVIDGVLQYMMRAWPGSEWLYTLEQALERMETDLGENDAVWLEKYADTAENLQDVVACGAEPVLLVKTDGSETENVETDNTETENTETENTETDNTETDNTETENAETENAETENAETENTESENPEANNAEINNAEAGNIETDNTETAASGIRLSTEKGSLSGVTYYYADPLEPTAGATVAIRQDGELYMELVTDENGEYTVRALPVGTYDITFSLAGYGDYYQENVIVTRDEAAVVDGYFFTNTTITGTVIDALTGEPLAEVEVELLIGDDETIYKQMVLTDENGDYTFDLTEESKSAALSELVKYFEDTDYSGLLEGSSVMDQKQLSPDGMSGYTMGISGSGVILFEKDGYAGGEVEITVTGFDSPYAGVTELSPQVEIGGYVFDANGNALGGVTISAVVIDDGSLSEQDDPEEGGDEDGTGSEGGVTESETAESAEETVNSDAAGMAAGTGSEIAAGSGGSVVSAAGTETGGAGSGCGTVSTAAVGDTYDTQTGVDGYYTLDFEMGSKITIRVTYSLSGYDTKTVEYEIDSSMVVDGKVQLANVSLTRTKQVVAGTSYASTVISFESGDPWTSMPNAMNPADALGEPDYVDNKNAVTHYMQ